MKKTAIVLSVFILAAAFTAAPSIWKKDKSHSRLSFTITHLSLSDVTGGFTDFDVDIQSEKPDFSDAVFTFTAKAASVNTDDEKRDAHLKTADFFDVEKYPGISFKSTSIKKSGNNTFQLTGNLTMHGVTKTVTMNLLHKGTIENPMNKKPTAVFQLTGKIDRTDFGIGNQFPAMVVGKEVTIKADGEFVKQ